MKLSLLTLISKDDETSFPAQTVGSGALTPMKGMSNMRVGLNACTSNHFSFCLFCLETEGTQAKKQTNNDYFLHNILLCISQLKLCSLI